MKTLNCICCDCELENIMGSDGHQPDDGLSFYSYGHYGTTFFDPMDGSYIQIAVCDPCLRTADAKGQIKRSKPKEAA